MPHPPHLPDSTAPHADWTSPAFQCTAKADARDLGSVRLAGELDMATAPWLARTLRSAELRTRVVVVDLRELTFMDSCGVHVIAQASVQARSAGRRLVLVRGPWQVDRVFTLAGVADLVEIIDLDPVEPPVQVFVQLAERDRAA